MGRMGYFGRPGRQLVLARGADSDPLHYSIVRVGNGVEYGVVPRSGSSVDDDFRVRRDAGQKA